MPLDGSNNSTSILDVSNSPATFTNNANSILLKTDIVQYGQSSARLPGTNAAYASSTNNKFLIGTSDFTLELWAYRTSSTLDRGIIHLRSGFSTYGGIAIGVNLGGSTWGIYAGNSERNGSITAAQNVWTHLAVTRQSGTLRLWVDGVQSISLTDNTNYSTANSIYLGQWYDDTYAFNGYVDDIRLTIGASRYNSPFSKPTAPFPVS
jgi:hypothetical protein